MIRGKTVEATAPSQPSHVAPTHVLSATSEKTEPFAVRWPTVAFTALYGRIVHTGRILSSILHLLHGGLCHTLNPPDARSQNVAELQLEGGELVLHLSGAEKAEAVHGDLRVPLSAVRGVEVLDDAHGWTGIGVGFKVGMRVPGVATVATVRGHGEKVFVAVHGDTPRGVRVRLEGAPWDEWIVGCPDPEAVAATLASAS